MRHYRVRDVMTAEPVTVNPATPLQEVADILVRQKITALPVVTLTGRAVGLITEAELLRTERIQQDPESQRWMHLSSRSRQDIVTAETAMKIMNMHPVTIRPAATVVEAARLMNLQRLPCLLVTGPDGSLLGLATARDLLRVMLRPAEEIRVEISDEVLAAVLPAVRADVAELASPGHSLLASPGGLMLPIQEVYLQ